MVTLSNDGYANDDPATIYPPETDWQDEPIDPSQEYWVLDDDIVRDSQLYDYLQWEKGMKPYEP